jgi:CheY-like chemotaxis protein/HD-like signal output (HDOD) protein
MTKILVVDDMPIFRDPIAASLRLSGFETVCASNGQEALAAVREHRPAVVLLDVSMPVMDGMTCLRTMRSEPEIAKTPVILFTALSDKKYVLEAGKLGVHDYMLKTSFSLKDLLARVMKYTGPATKPDKPAGGAAGGAASSNAGATSAATGMASAGTGTASAAAGPGTSKAPDSQAPAASGGKAAGAPASPAASAASAACAPPAFSIRKAASPTAAEPSLKGDQLMTRDQCIARAEKALAAKTLSGAVAEVVTLAASPRGNVSDLAPLIARDPMLSARVLQAANSAAYISSRPVVSTIPDAVRQIGMTTVRSIASALGIFDAMPPTSADGFNPIRCWQHSFAVAMLCERMVPKDAPEAGLVYLVGLCHDLGEILFHTHFGKEYGQVLEVQARSGRRMDEVEKEMLGISRGELVQTIIGCIGLPEMIKEPIRCFHDGIGNPGAGTTPLTRVLRIAELYANGLLLASSGRSPVAPVSKAECKAALGREDPKPPDLTAFRSEVFYTTGVLARLSEDQARAVMTSPYERTKARLCVVRESGLSPFDPMLMALQSMTEVRATDRLPDVVNAGECQGLVVLSPSDLTAGFTAPEVQAAATKLGGGKGPVPVLWSVGRINGMAQQGAKVSPVRWPLRLDDLYQFIQHCGGAATGVPAAAA